jgi:tRNA-2-methylthio-N6-dimethylallyladenosine synthase
VHFSPTGPAVAGAVRAGDVVTTVVTGAAPHHVVADGPVLSHRLTRAGDRHAQGLLPRTAGVGLGLPGFGKPVPAAAAQDSRPAAGCSTC